MPPIEPSFILSFIQQFKSAHDFFMYGMCYWFAVILKERFKAGGIIHDPIANHFMWRYNGLCYDVEGMHRIPNRIETMEDIAKDELYYKRIIRDCIHKEREI